MAAPLEIDNMSLADTNNSSSSSSPTQSIVPKQGRRRSRRTYPCLVENCGKVYSRAEHLNRHHLNHDPKEIFRCDVPNCDRAFVRLDLHSRHKARHMSEYQQQQTNSSLSKQNDSTQSLESIGYAEESILDDGSRPQLPPPYARSLFPSSIQYSQTPRPAAFPIFEEETPVRITPNNIHQNTTIPPEQQLLDIAMWRNKVPTPVGMPIFGSDSRARSPFTIPDDFIQFLFDGNNPDNATINDNLALNTLPSYSNIQSQFSENASNIFCENHLPQILFTPNTISYETNLPSTELSNEKSQEIFDLVKDRLAGNNHCPVADYQNSLLGGDRSQDFNIMSTKRMQSHIDGYWRNFHPQLPILHRPTFSPNKTPNLLLIAIMILGCSCSIKSDDHTTAKSATEFSTVLAWYLRWEIFSRMHMQFDDLWVFQALLLLETYEKTYSSRILHERAHIHHATTITLMRRGSFLLGRSPLDSPPSREENLPESEAMTRSSTEVWWDEWIRREATRRVAFAAFMIDSTHAAMFGHSMIMVTHEMRLVLPCDEALWSATSVDEVWKIETTLRSNGVKPLSFLEGLRSTLNGQEIFTNAFGRSLLLSGLLSVSWHMNQRDLQLNSLAAGSHHHEKARGTKWRRCVTRAFDMWKVAYEQAAAENLSDNNELLRSGRQAGGEDAVLQSRAALYYLSRFSMHVDIVECQVFAGANQVLGRNIRKEEMEASRRRIRNTWAPTVDARKATFYALRFLCSVFYKNTTTTDDKGGGGDHQVFCCDRDFVINYATSKTTLSTHRWVLYSAALVVWCYSYAVDGPTHAAAGSMGSSIDDHIQDMQNFLKRVDNIKSSEDVAYYRLNSCAGMLKVLRYIFRMGTWELLHEGADLLTNCIMLIDRSS